MIGRFAVRKRTPVSGGGQDQPTPLVVGKPLPAEPFPNLPLPPLSLKNKSRYATHVARSLRC